MSFPIELKLVWQEQFLGISLNQIIDTHSIPMTSYFIWPKTDAWEQLNFELDSKPWLQEAEKVMVLNGFLKGPSNHEYSQEQLQGSEPVTFGTTLGSLLSCEGHFGATLRSLWGHFSHMRVTLGQLGGHFGITFCI